MSFQFQTTSFWAFTLVLMSLTTVPVQISAHLVGARRTSMYAAAMAVALASAAALLVYTLMGSGWLGGGAALAAMLVVYKVVLGTYWDAAAVLAATVFSLQSAVLWIMANLGILELQGV